MGYNGTVGMEAFARDKEEDALETFRAAFTL
jgi:hydroxypyruvate isomerase